MKPYTVGFSIAFAVCTATQVVGMPISCSDVDIEENLRLAGQKLDYDATRPSTTETGAYGITLGSLVHAGFVESYPRRPLSQFFGESAWDGVIWTGKEGIYSRADFLASPEAQECALHLLLSGKR